MDTCILHPPNSQRFSGNVIMSTMQRVERTSNSFVVQDSSSLREESESHQRLQPFAPTLLEFCSYVETEKPSRNAPSEDTKIEHSNTTLKAVVEKKRKWQELEMSVNRDMGSSQLRKNDDQVVVSARLVVNENERLRELRRMRQIRYRKKKENYALSLEEETRRLRGEIESLSQQKRAVSVAAMMNDSVWNVAAEYFRLFRYGLSSTGPNQFSFQQDFVRSKMASDVVVNGTCGQDALLKSWRCLSESFEDMEVELEGMEKVVGGSVLATTTTSLTIAQRTLHSVFRHLCSPEGDHTEVALADKLVGQRIVLCGTTRLDWDSSSSCVTRVEAQSDMLTPMLRLVGSLEDVSFVFEGSFVSPSFQFRRIHK